MTEAPQEQTPLTMDETFGLGTFWLRHPPGTFALTPASCILISAIGQHQALLSGAG